MHRARMLGNCVEYLAQERGVSDETLCNVLQCDRTNLLAFLKGRRIASFDQLSALAEVLEVSVAQLLKGDEKHYEESVVHCMNQFSDPKNREEILDLIDDYMDVLDALEGDSPLKNRV